jgi:uncharacterized protein with GYD domain
VDPTEEGQMATFVVFIDWTEQGVGTLKDSVDRYEAGQSQFDELGVRFRDVY